MEAITYFQSMLTFKSIFTFKSQPSIRFSKSENQLAHALINEGRAAAAAAAAEMKNGKTALSIVVSEKDETLKKNLAQIACWHYTDAVSRFRRAAAEFEQAARIWQQTKRRKVLEGKANKMLEMARHSEAAIKFLKQF